MVDATLNFPHKKSCRNIALPRQLKLGDSTQSVSEQL
jgi:hypothetical protein